MYGAGARVTRKAKTFSNGFRSSMYNYCITAKNALFSSQIGKFVCFDLLFGLIVQVKVPLEHQKYPYLSTDALFAGQTSGFFPDKRSLYVDFISSESSGYHSFHYDTRIKAYSRLNANSIRRKASSPLAFLHNLGCLYSIKTGSPISLSSHRRKNL